MIITTELAQQIVDNIMPLVDHNVNIMNSSGMIVGSGQKNRIHTYHQGAKDVLETGNVVEIYPDNLERYPGSMPGLNWPIMLGKQIVGVVGVSGHPDSVRNTAKLVKMVAELILERESLIEQFRVNLELKEQFVHLLMSERYQENYTQIRNIANLLRFDLSLPRLAMVLNVRDIFEDAFYQYGLHELVTSRTRENLAQLIESSGLVNAKDLLVFTDDDLIILKHFPASATSAVFTKWGSEVIRLLRNENYYGPIRMGLGSLIRNSLEIYYSCQEALFAKNNCPSSENVASIYDFNILVSYLVSQPGARNSCIAFKELKELINKKLDYKYDMKSTIQALLNYNLNMSATAKALFIHRNTLVFRLEKLKKLTGLCPGQFLNHALLCKLLLSA